MFKQLLQKVESIDTQTSLTEQIMVAKSSDEVKVLLKFTPDDNYAMQKRLIILEFVASWCGLCDQVLMFRSSHIFTLWFLVFWSLWVHDFLSIFFPSGPSCLHNS